MLESIWFFIWGLLWAIFFMTDGFDFGVGMLLPFIGKSEEEKRIMINTIGPLWDGNEVWLLTAGGVTFAAFPKVYAVMFSSLYSALMLILFALILRGVSFEFRSKVNSPAWRTFWDLCIFLGSILPALLFGVAFGNIFQGIAFDGEGIYRGTLFTLLNPYGILTGLLFLLLFLEHGALWLCIRTEGALRERAIAAAEGVWSILFTATIVFLVATVFTTRLYHNYHTHPLLLIVILVTVFALFGIRSFFSRQAFFKAWFSSALTIVGATFFGIIGLFPTMFPSSLNAVFNLTAHNASSSPLTLKIMLTVVIIFVPIVLAYQIWAYALFRKKITTENLADEGVY